MFHIDYPASGPTHSSTQRNYIRNIGAKVILARLTSFCFTVLFFTFCASIGLLILFITFLFTCTIQNGRNIKDMHININEILRSSNKMENHYEVITKCNSIIMQHYIQFWQG